MNMVFLAIELNQNAFLLFTEICENCLQSSEDFISVLIMPFKDFARGWVDILNLSLRDIIAVGLTLE